MVKKRLTALLEKLYLLSLHSELYIQLQPSFETLQGENSQKESLPYFISERQCTEFYQQAQHPRIPSGTLRPMSLPIAPSSPPQRGAATLSVFRTAGKFKKRTAISTSSILILHSVSF